MKYLDVIDEILRAMVNNDAGDITFPCQVLLGMVGEDSLTVAEIEIAQDLCGILEVLKQTRQRR